MSELKITEGEWLLVEGDSQVIIFSKERDVIAMKNHDYFYSNEKKIKTISN